LAGIRWRVGYNRKWGRLLTHRLDDRKALGERHEVEYNLDLVRALGLPTQTPQWHLPRFSHEQAEVFQLLEQAGMKRSERFIAVHPWTSNPRKQWPPERYLALMRLIAERRSERIVVIGSPEERHRASALLPAGAPVVNLVGRLALKPLAALLQCARTLVSNDSGPVHLAAAVGTPTVVLFGTTDAATGPQRWGPWGNNHTVIWKPSMEAISVEEVFTALQDCLQRAVSKTPGSRNA
jgi:ADP-heptose:LPS heptosyltransferase